MEEFYNPYEPVDRFYGTNLPHWQQGKVMVFATWRLADSLSAGKLEQLRRERKLWLLENSQPWNERQANEYRELFSRRIESWLDAGQGSCCLRKAELRQIVFDGFKHFDGQRYGLDSFVIMPNHVHVLFYPIAKHQMQKILYSWKSFTAKQINAAIGRKGPLWAEDYWDRLIRNSAHLEACRRYILRNPVKANLRAGEYALYPAR
ncbi:MAG TPA: transposase [Opitutales bacterium]|nr:transposase [Opitutales bacterium]